MVAANVQENRINLWLERMPQEYGGPKWLNLIPLQLGHKIAQCFYNFAAQQRAEQFELRLKPV